MSEKLKRNLVGPATIVIGLPSSVAGIVIGAANMSKIEHGQAAFLDYETANTLYFGGLAVAVASLLVLWAAYRKN